MSSIIDNCFHKNEIITECGYVCSDCGLCKDSLFEKPLEISQQIYQENNPLSSEITNLIKESLERLNLPAYLYKFVVKSIQKNDKSLKLTKASVAHHLYTTLSEFNTPFTLKKICGVTGTPKNKISKEQKKSVKSSIIFIKTEDLLERYCCQLSINFKKFTLIKEKIPQIDAGYNPSTIVSAYIYLFCKADKVKLTLKQISFVTGISCMSIQRYIKKNELSSWAKIPER